MGSSGGLIDVNGSNMAKLFGCMSYILTARCGVYMHICTCIGCFFIFFFFYVACTCVCLNVLDTLYDFLAQSVAYTCIPIQVLIYITTTSLYVHTTL